MGINNAEFCADFETVEKNAKNLLTKKLGLHPFHSTDSKADV
jgi:hypothetical protein